MNGKVITHNFPLQTIIELFLSTFSVCSFDYLIKRKYSTNFMCTQAHVHERERFYEGLREEKGCFNSN